MTTVKTRLSFTTKPPILIPYLCAAECYFFPLKSCHPVKAAANYANVENETLHNQYINLFHSSTLLIIAPYLLLMINE